MVWKKSTGCFVQNARNLQYTNISISCSHTPWPVRAKTLYTTCLCGYVREVFLFYMWVKIKQLGSLWGVWLQSEAMLSTT